MPGSLVSVVMAVRDGERFVAEAIDSVLAQDGVELELIVTDDGSTDGTAAILARAGEDPRVTVLTRPPRGAAAARNAALAACRGAYVAFLDADDVWLPGKLRRQLDAFAADPGLALVLTAYFVGPGPERPRGLVRQADLAGWLELDGDGPAFCSTAMLRRAALGSELRLEERLAISEDIELTRRVLRTGAVATLAEPLALYRHHGGQHHTDLGALARDAAVLYGAQRTRKARRAFANVAVRRLAAELRAGELRAAAGRLRQALAADPTRLVLLPLHGVARRWRRRALAWSHHARHVPARPPPPAIAHPVPDS